jgi:hypothetical protein
MIKNMNDGGSAFPLLGWQVVRDFTRPDAEPESMHSVIQPGMSLRDWFAGMALQGTIASYAGANCPDPSPDRLAETAYLRADAMLAERNKQKE